MTDATSPASRSVKPRVVAFSGHMIDAPGRATPRFPARLERSVKAALDLAITELAPAEGYSQAACGSDILFCEAMFARGQEVHIVLPFALDDFIAESVAIAGASWIARFERIMAAATTTTYAPDGPYDGDPNMFEDASQLIQALALARADVLGSLAHLLVVADQSQAGATGGTLSMLASWIATERQYTFIDLAAIRAAS
jgi:hypothetical protein